MIRTIDCLVGLKSGNQNKLSSRPATPQGWTLIEIAAIAVIVGILASLAVPNMVGTMYKNKVQAGLARVKGALQEAQRNAIRMGKECKVTITAGSNPSIIVNSETKYLGCLSEQYILEDVELLENFPGTTIRFSYKGNTTNLGTIVVQSPNTNAKHCLVSSNFLGIIRSGVYNGDTTSSISATNCQSSL